MRRHFVALSGGIGVLLGAALAWPFTVDDSFIVARYAHHLITGLGYRMNPGDGPSDGVTGPLWLLPAMVDAWLAKPEVSDLWVSKLVGIVCGCLGAMWSLTALARRGRGVVASRWAALVLVLQPSYWTWIGAGLETAAGSLGLVATAVTRHPVVASAACGLLCWLRPELVPVAVTLSVLRFWGRTSLYALLPAATLALAVLLFRYLLFEHVVPLTVVAKPASLRVGLEYCARGVLLTTSGVGCLPLFWVWGRGFRDRCWLASWLLALLCVVLSGGDWMPGFRLFAPLLPLYAGLVGVGLERLGRRSSVAACLLGLGSCALPAMDAVTRVPELWDSAVARAAVARPLGAALRARPGPVALVDVGYLGLVSQQPVMDLGGLTAPDIGRLPGAHLDKRIDKHVLAHYNPAQAVLHSQALPRVDATGRLLYFRGYPVEQRFARIANVRRNYRVQQIFRYTDSYYYIWLVRVD